MPPKLKTGRSRESLNATLRHPAILTPRQVQILRMIQDYRNDHGCSPTLQELAENLKLSKVTVFEHVEALVKKGILRREANKARSLIISESVRLSGTKSVPDRQTITALSPKKSPAVEPGQYRLAGSIAAGKPIEAIENPDWIDLRKLFETREGTFALSVKGDSMIDDHICDGDIVLVKPSHEARNGDIVVAILSNNEATLKRFFKEKGFIRLQASNPDYPPIRIKNINIQGIVVGILRRFPG